MYICTYERVSNNNLTASSSTFNGADGTHMCLDGAYCKSRKKKK